MPKRVRRSVTEEPFSQWFLKAVALKLILRVHIFSHWVEAKTQTNERPLKTNHCIKDHSDFCRKPLELKSK